MARYYTVHFDVSFTVDGDSEEHAEQIARTRFDRWVTGAENAVEPDYVELVDAVPHDVEDCTCG